MEPGGPAAPEPPDDEQEQPRRRMMAGSPRSDKQPKAFNATPDESHERRELVRSLLSSGAPRSLVIRTLREKLGITEGQALAAYDRVCQESRDEFEKSRPYIKSEQVDRLRRDLARMRSPEKGRDGKAAQQVSYRAIAQHEALLARITGTVEPVKMDVSVEANVREALVAVVGTMSVEEQDALVEEQLALERRAGELPPASAKRGEPVAEPEAELPPGPADGETRH